MGSSSASDGDWRGGEALMEDEASVWPAIEGALGPRSSEACGLANCRCAVESARGCPRRGPYPITGRCINIVLHVLQYPRVVHRTPPKLLHSCTAQATQHLPFPRAHGPSHPVSQQGRNSPSQLRLLYYRPDQPGYWPTCTGMWCVFPYPSEAVC